jgi:hypothetical protein
MYYVLLTAYASTANKSCLGKAKRKEPWKGINSKDGPVIVIADAREKHKGSYLYLGTHKTRCKVRRSVSTNLTSHPLPLSLSKLPLQKHSSLALTNRIDNRQLCVCKSHLALSRASIGLPPAPIAPERLPHNHTPDATPHHTSPFLMPSSHGHGIFSSSLFRSSKPREITDNPASQVASDPDPPAPLPQSHSPSVTRTAPSQSYYHHSVRRSISSQISFVSPLKRSISLRSGLRSDYSNPPASPSRPNNVLTLPAFVVDRQSSADALNHARAPSHSSKGSTSLDPSRQPASANMTSVQYRNPPSARPPPTAQPNMSLYTQSNGSLGAPAPISSTSAPGSQNPQAVYQHILDTSSKRISTLDYLRKS